MAKIIRVEKCGECPCKLFRYEGFICRHPNGPDGLIKLNIIHRKCPLEDEK